MKKRRMTVKWDPVPAFIVWNRVVALREKLNLTQVQLAAGAHIAIATLYAIEQGMGKTAKGTQEKIARFLNVRVEDIFPAEMMGMVPFDEWAERHRAEQERACREAGREAGAK